MKIQTQIKSDMIAAMKAKDNETKSLLKVVIGEFNRVAKEVDDNKAISIIKKMHENAVEQHNNSEISILEKYLPTLLSDDEAQIAIEKLILNNGLTSMRDMGQAMNLIKSTFGASVDGKYASVVVRKLLS